MGMCLPCLGGNSSDYDEVDPETRRKLQLEAAERRRSANEGRGVKDAGRLHRRQRELEEQERRQAELDRLDRMAGNQGGGLKWTVH